MHVETNEVRPGIRIAGAVMLLAITQLGCAADSAAPAGVPAAKAPCTDLSRSCVIEVVRSYIQGHFDPKQRPRLAKHVKAVHNGLVTDDGTAETTPYTFDMTGLRARGPDRVWVDGNEAIASWTVDAADPKTGKWAQTTHLFERFKVEKGVECAYGHPAPCITELEAVYCTGPHPEEAPWPKATPYYDPHKKFGDAYCFRSGGT